MLNQVKFHLEYTVWCKYMLQLLVTQRRRWWYCKISY